MESTNKEIKKEVLTNEVEDNVIKTAPNQPPQPVATSEKKNNKWWIWLLGCCGGCLVFVIIVLIVGYFTIGKKVINEVKDLSETGSEFNIEEFQQDIFNEMEKSYEESEDDYIKKDNLIAGDPSDTVENYLNSTLGTLPNSSLDVVEAKSYLSPELKEQYDDPLFVQQTLCIQDGPTDIKVSNKDLFGEEAYITVKAEYGDEFMDIWDFALEMKNDKWVIYAIYCLKN